MPVRTGPDPACKLPARAAMCCFATPTGHRIMMSGHTRARPESRLAGFGVVSDSESGPAHRGPGPGPPGPGPLAALAPVSEGSCAVTGQAAQRM